MEQIKRRRLSAKERNYFYKMYNGRCRTCRKIKGSYDIESFRKTISILIMRYAGISEQVQFYFEKVREHEKF